MTGDRVSIVVLGGGGDLTRRLLLPGLASLLVRYPRDIQIIGAGLQDSSDEEWHGLIRDSFAKVEDPDEADRYLTSARWFTADVTKADELQQLLEACEGVPVLYFALPPAVTAKVCAVLSSVRLPEGTRLALEKPFGTDLESARDLNLVIARLVPENQVFRIDHFLGMSTVLNLLGLRFSNRVLEDVWDAGHVERVEIIYDETLGLEGRGGYYDNAGALVDMLQSHLLQVAALVAMEPPPKIDEVELRSNVAQVLRNTHLWDDDPVAAARRARYTAGAVRDRELPGYADEEGVDPSRMTETLAELTVGVRTRRWRDVPFVLRSGKALGQYRTLVRVVLKPASPIEGFAGAPSGDRIELDLKSNEVSLHLTMNGGGDPFTLERSELTVTKEAGDLLPYGQVLRGILDGDPLLSVRGDIAEECWRIVEPVLEAWRENRTPLEEYPAGSAGPEGW